MNWPPIPHRPELAGLTWNYLALNRIYLADCIDLMRAIKAEQDRGNPVFAKRRILAMIDPPFGIGMDGHSPGKGNKSVSKAPNNTKGTFVPTGNYKTGDWDKSTPNSAFFQFIFSISHNSIIKGGNYFDLPPSRCWIVWDKVNGNCDQADGELLWTTFKTSVRIFPFMWQGMYQGKSIEEGKIQQGDKRKNQERVHQCQSPWQLWAWLLDNYAKPGDLILDTHSGSGSVARACVKRGFDFIACEIDPDYHRDSLRLLAQAKAGIQPRTDSEIKQAGGQRSLFDQM